MVGYWMEKEWVPGYKIPGEPNNGVWKAKIQVKLENLENYVKTTSKNQMEIEPKEDKYIFGPLKIKVFRDTFYDLVDAMIYEEYSLPSYIRDNYGRLYAFDSASIKTREDHFCEAAYNEVLSILFRSDFEQVMNDSANDSGVMTAGCPSLITSISQILIIDESGEVVNIGSWQDLSKRRFSPEYTLVPNEGHADRIFISIRGDDSDLLEFSEIETNFCSSKQVNRDTYDITLAQTGAAYESKLSPYLRITKGNRTYRIMKYELDNKKNRYKLRLMSQ